MPYSLARDRRETLARLTQFLSRRRPEMGVTDDAVTLCSLSRSLSRIAERGCNEDRHCRECDGNGSIWAPETLAKTCGACAGTGSMDGKRERRIEDRVRGIASQYGCRVYFQGDPRGAAVYLIPEESGPAGGDDSHYSQRGIAAY